MAYPAPPPPLKVVLIEDSLLVRQTMGAVLGEMVGLEVVGGAADEAAAIELLLRQQPDLAIVDLQLRSGSGLGVLRALAREPERFGRPRAVVFSHHNHALLREHCQALGAERFFDKATQLAELLAYVRQALPS
ncbi:MAG: response regulator [Betaproteobacteria bacterium HGW-Betaproteobacteria-12]|nr:MAG: response regulator [Betaproteobacteria bacterium HGW-Betaproteobacteria-12]